MTRMVPFIYSSTIAYTIEMGNEYMSFFYDGELLDADGAPISTPYQTADLPQLQFEQVGDVMWITHPSYAQRKLSRTTATTFSLDVVTYERGPFLIRNDIANDDGVTMTYAGGEEVDGTGTLTASTAMFEADHEGALFQLTYPRKTEDAKVSCEGADDSDYIFIKGNFTFNTHGTWTGTVELRRTEGDNAEEVYRTFIANGDRNIQFTATEQSYNVKYRIVTAAGMSSAFGADITANTSTTTGIVRVDTFSSTTVVNVTVLAYLGENTGSSTLRWAEGAWSDVQGYPKSVTFFADRCVFAGQRYGWIGRVGDYENFDAGTLDSDAFTVSLTTGNEIMWVDTVDKTIVFGTTGNPWSLQSNRVGTVMTPTNFTLDEESGIGSADIQGIRINNAIIFVDYNQKKLMEYGYNADRQKYVSNEISVLAEHLTATSTITWLSWQKNPESIIWFGMADGTLHSFTYQRDQNVLAYASHPTTGEVNSGCVIPSTSEDEIWLSVERALDAGTVTCIERMTPRRITDDDDAHFVDSGVNYSGSAITEITGGDHLDGETVAILADGVVQTPQVVTGGKITLGTAAGKVHYGLPFDPYLKPMRLDNETGRGSSHGTIKKIPELVLSILNSTNVRYGDLSTNMYSVNLDEASLVNNGEITGLFTGDVTVSQDGGFSIEDSILISSDQTSSVTDPTPLTVRAIVARLDETGR